MYLFISIFCTQQSRWEWARLTVIRFDLIEYKVALLGLLSLRNCSIRLFAWLLLHLNWRYLQYPTKLWTLFRYSFLSTKPFLWTFSYLRVTFYLVSRVTCEGALEAEHFRDIRTHITRNRFKSRLKNSRWFFLRVFLVLTFTCGTAFSNVPCNRL